MSQEAAKGDAPGRLSPLKQAAAKVQKICDQVKPQAEKMAGQQFPEFKAISYKTQVVAGINYFIKNPSSSDKVRNPVPGIRNQRRGIQNPRLSCIPLHGVEDSSEKGTA
ncbi:unnamed protein product [Porites evermanni]|uniref:Cystatin domain-containing protein n=1 Tax=Porites evermanni TaxID=104178 RepID=A0ABN8LYW2_9CNID|nr:unnamed protein product [Porites evermanni]